MLSIIIISYKRKDDLKECVFELQKKVLIDYEIIIINNDSVNIGFNSNYIIELSQEQNLGVAGGRNFGASKANYDNLFFIDDDAILDSYITENTIKIMNFDSPILATISRDYYTQDLRLNENVNVNSLGYCNKYVGVGHFIKKSFFDKIDGYDLLSKYGMEEFNIIYKMLNLNKKIKMSNITVRHKKNDKGRDISYEDKIILGKSKISYIAKHSPSEIIISHFVLWTIYSLIRSNKFIPISFLVEKLKQQKDYKFNRFLFYKTALSTNTNIFY